MDYDLGYFNMDSCRLKPGPNPFGPRVLNDLSLLMSRGDPKYVWMNPAGGHIGRSPKWSAAEITQKVVFPWAQRKLQSYDRRQTKNRSICACDFFAVSQESVLIRICPV